MNDQQCTDFAFLTARLAELAAASSCVDPQLALLAKAAVKPLLAHAAEKFPGLLTDYKASRKQAADAATATMGQVGPKMWAELHTRAQQPVANATMEKGYLYSFATRLPCGDCRKTFQQYIQGNPPDFAAYFAWTVGLHNFVNNKLGKPQLSLADAQARWPAQ